MAKRNKMKIVNKPMLKLQQAEQKTFLEMSVFEYLIGNTIGRAVWAKCKTNCQRIH
jgi:hypothetical protein